MIAVSVVKKYAKTLSIGLSLSLLSTEGAVYNTPVRGEPLNTQLQNLVARN